MEAALQFGEISPYAQRAERAIKVFTDLVGNAKLEVPIPRHEDLLKVASKERNLRVGIIGAGAAGLFTAMIFDYLKKTYGLEVDYEILEARGEDRLGGRLYSHKFGGSPTLPEPGKHDYFDVGAMRFPDHAIMERVFKLFDRLGMKKHVTADVDAPIGALVPYYLKGPKQSLLYNGVRIEVDSGIPTARRLGINHLPNNILDKNPYQLVSDAIKEFIDTWKEQGPEAFWDKLEKEADPYTVRQYLMQVKMYDFETVQFLETVNYGDGWYNQGLSEMIVETLIFGLEAKWWCVEGGSQEIAHKMLAKIEKSDAVKFRKAVVKMEYATNEKDEIDVHLRGEAKPQRYDAVFNSAPLGAMQHMQLEGLNLNWATKSAIRSLGYGASCKVGVRFKKLWWISLGITKGGASKTDLPIRCCVYPSYNVSDEVDSPGVLLVSYCWSQEAERLGALIDRRSPEGEDALKETLIHDLARLHAVSGNDEDYEKMRKVIADNYLDHFAYDWRKDPYSAGAFAYFGPGQFGSMFQSITASNGKHIIIGEAASAHHAWLVGSLESAVRGVYQFLLKHQRRDPAAFEACLAYYWGQVEEPYGPLPAEYRVRGRGIDGLENLAELQFAAENERLKQGGDELRLNGASISA